MDIHGIRKIKCSACEIRHALRPPAMQFNPHYLRFVLAGWRDAVGGIKLCECLTAPGDQLEALPD
jgi:hypothetical protein